MGARAAQRLIDTISGEGRNEPAPLLVGGPVLWRASVLDRRPAIQSQLKVVRED
jgi:hypothetical protein